jgi:hypothetical protein
LQGTGNVSGAIALGNTTSFVGSDGLHPTPQGINYMAKRLAAALIQAWNGNY